MDATSSSYGSSCTLYDILGIEHDATVEDVRKAYRKLALKWHPDKQNQVSDADQQLALETFRQVSNAYEILSDERERQWYDAKLRRLQKSSSRQAYTQTVPEDFTDVSSVVLNKDYMNGYFTLEEYLPLFKKIASLESGHSYPDYKACPVQVFYAEWGSFASSLDFSWIDEPISRNLDRRVRRMIEQEHAKARRQARKEYNESIRTLAEFCKRRDPAYTEWFSSYQKAKEEQIKESIVSKTQKKEQRQQQQQQQQEGIEEESFEEDISHDVWYCPACEKYFKSEGSFSSHEKSKKHIKNVEIMKHMLMLEEDFVHMDLHTDDDDTNNSNDASLSSAKTNCRGKKERGHREKNKEQDDKQNDNQGDRDNLPSKTKRRRRRDKSSRNTTNASLLCCNVCKEEFPSRNQLFRHIKETNHACQV